VVDGTPGNYCRLPFDLPVSRGDLILVLSARRIPYRIEEGSGAVMVPEPFYLDALGEIEGYLEDNRGWPSESSASSWPFDARAGWQFIVVTGVLSWLLSDPLGLDLSQKGSAQAAAIVLGGWYRAVTALTLHVDPAHLLGNMLFGFIFFLPLSFRFGNGLSWLLTLLAGAGGNLAAAYISGGYHHSIGASTAVMAEVGIMASLDLRDALARGGWSRVFRTLAAGMALFSILGMGDKANVDYLGHLCGFLAGLPAGFMGSLMLNWSPSIVRSGWPGGLALLLLAASWGAALWH